MSDFAFAGKSFEFRIDNGVVFRNFYSSDGKRLRYATLDGPAERVSEEVELFAAEFAPNIYMVGWNEISGATVVHVMNFKNHTMCGFWSFPEDDDRSGEIHSGTFAEAK
ncbi:MoaF-related domain-containing protein [Glycomyces buryatensis]|uniref:Adenylate cyclase n=1 Tax=Glycomyces buryatensis TaxID=2570927 RepID=A0A4S8Q539_9ACTN|nr:adenylate cyclase [Glycomyces buryatensis]THV37735.1 adenylate cyclase [Glycomyces buryatensis]